MISEESQRDLKGISKESLTSKGYPRDSRGISKGSPRDLSVMSEESQRDLKGQRELPI